MDAIAAAVTPASVQVAGDFFSCARALTFVSCVCVFFLSFFSTSAAAAFFFGSFCSFLRAFCDFSSSNSGIACYTPSPSS